MKSKLTNSSLNSKIPEIEGLRTLAITMVFLFHYFSRWTPPLFNKHLYPYNFELAKEVSKFGYLGVQLFFMISGFVILSSLERQRNLKSFAFARFKRIYPSLWIAIPVIYIICNILNQSFIAPIQHKSLIPSLTLVGPDFVNTLFHTKLNWCC